MKRCNTCKYFVTMNSEEGWGGCALAIENNIRYIPNGVPNVEAMMIPFGMQSPEGSLTVRENFGCVCHEDRLEAVVA